MVREVKFCVSTLLDDLKLRLLFLVCMPEISILLVIGSLSNLALVVLYSINSHANKPVSLC